jgi:anaerobic magnesium-protoporphyrin IX monomethyl ester cyclase
MREKLKLLLITPPYHAGVVEAAGSWPNIGFVYIAGHVRAAGFNVEIYDAMTKGHTIQQIKEHIINVKPDIVGSTAYTSSINDALAVLRVAKEANSEIITLLGGIHANFCYRELLEENPDVLDVVVTGEGEFTTPELMECLSSGQGLDKVLGIVYREDGTINANPPRPFIEDLDSLIPAWDLVDWQDYSFYVMPGSRLGIVNSSRGCVNECSFCSQQKFWHRTYRERKAEKFVEELEFLRDTYGVNVVMLSDEYATRNRERWERILDLMIERQTNVYLLLETCVGDIIRDADIMWKYRKAGVLHIYVGVEATSQDMLDHFKKNIACEESKEAIRLINDAGMLTECSFVLGMPDETPESIENTLSLAKHYNPDFAHFLMIAPWPYADIYEELKDYVVEKDFAKYNFVEPVVKPKNMSMEELSKAVIDCYRRYYVDKVKEYDKIPDEFKRDYLLRSMKVMMENSFLVKHITGMGEIPEEVKKYLNKNE